MFYTHRIPGSFSWLFGGYQWRIPTEQKVIYLSFDDGPIPEVTPEVLSVLKSYAAKATFFCVGDNIQKHPSIFEQVLADGHRVGNHTFHHYNGWRTPTPTYLDDVQQCQALLPPASDAIFRPPYGAIRWGQADYLRKRGYRIVMWSLLSGDFDVRLRPQDCLRASIAGTQRGTIVVFHDSLKAWPRLSYVLPRYLEHFQDQGFGFDVLPTYARLR